LDFFKRDIKTPTKKKILKKKKKKKKKKNQVNTICTWLLPPHPLHPEAPHLRPTLPTTFPGLR
jgi:hypothetical protein